jgi:hypothetical protein
MKSLNKPPLWATDYYLGGKVIPALIPCRRDAPSDWAPDPLQNNSSDIFLSMRERI